MFNTDDFRHPAMVPKPDSPDPRVRAMRRKLASISSQADTNSTGRTTAQMTSPDGNIIYGVQTRFREYQQQYPHLIDSPRAVY